MTERPIIDSSSWTGLPSHVRRIEDEDGWAYGLTEAEDAELARDYRRHDRSERFKALCMLWGPAIVNEGATRRRRDGVIVYSRDRGDDWTFWRAFRASVAIILNRRWHQAHVDKLKARTGSSWAGSFDLGYWDAESNGYGYSNGYLNLYPGWRVEIGLDGESFL